MTDQNNQATGRKTPWIAVGIASGVSLLAIGVHAQEQGTLATLGLSFGGQYTANDPDPDESRFTTNLSFDLESRTAAHSFGISADGQLLLDQDSSGIDNPSIGVTYAWSNRTTTLSFATSYREQDVDGDLEVIDPLTLSLVDLIEDDGTQESLRASAGLVTGRGAPFGTNTQLSYTSRTYSGTTDPDLTDLETARFSTTLRFDIDPRISLRSVASYTESREDDAEDTDRRTTRAGIGADLEIDPVWSASIDLNYSIIETERNDGFGGRILTETNGGGATLALSREFRNGTLGLTLARDITENGAEDSLRLSRATELANGGSLDWSLGVVSFEGGEVAPLASLSYAQPTPRGNVSINLQQSTAVDSDDRSTIRTSLGIGYNETINTVSSWSVNGSLASIDVVGSEADDQLSASIGLGYNHALTEDWSLSTRLRHRIAYEGGTRDNSASTLSFSLQRSFSFRP